MIAQARPRATGATAEATQRRGAADERGGALREPPPEDAELRATMPGLEGCGAVVALLSGQNLCIGVAGRSARRSRSLLLVWLPPPDGGAPEQCQQGLGFHIGSSSNSNNNDAERKGTVVPPLPRPVLRHTVRRGPRPPVAGHQERRALGGTGRPQRGLTRAWTRGLPVRGGSGPASLVRRLCSSTVAHDAADYGRP